MIAFLEALGLLACLFAVGFALRARTVLSVDSRRTLLALLLTVAVGHSLDIVEWTVYPPIDRLGDIAKVLIPVAWLLFLFVVTRDGLHAKVQEQGHQLDFFLDYAPVAVAILDAQGVLIGSTRRWQAMHGTSPSSIGSRLRDLPTQGSPEIPGEGWREFWHQVTETALGHGETNSGVERFTSGDREAWVEWSVRPWKQQDAIAGAILVVELVTDRIVDQRQREQTQVRLLKGQALEMVGEVATGVAHDVNNLLQVISGQAELLSVDGVSKAVVARSLDSILQAVGTASGMTQWLLAFGRESEPSFEDVDLVALVLQLQGLLHRALPPGQELGYELAEDPVVIQGDATLLEQLVINLVLNARDAMEGSGKITISVEVLEGQPTLSVRDEGSGIESELLEKILEPFFTTKGAEGTGVGLAVVQRAAKSHGAELRIDSVVGEGSCFTVCFPAAEGVANGN